MALPMAGETALHLAAEEGHPEVVALLLAGGADATALDHMDRTPLARAAAKGRTLVGGLLLEAGSDPARLDADSWNCRQTSEFYGHADFVEMLLAFTRTPKQLRIGIPNGAWDGGLWRQVRGDCAAGVAVHREETRYRAHFKGELGALAQARLDAAFEAHQAGRTRPNVAFGRLVNGQAARDDDHALLAGGAGGEMVVRMK